MLSETTILVAEWKRLSESVSSEVWSILSESSWSIYEESQQLSKVRGYGMIGCCQYSFQGLRTFDTCEEEMYSSKPEGFQVG